MGNSGHANWFHDVIIPSNNGTTQVDHILVSPFGLFIVETKNLKGWIYGSETQSKWTQVVYKNKYSFQNPLKQTYRHKKVLSKFLDLNESNIETVVYFNGNSEFKTELPSNVLSYGLGSYIQQFEDTVLSNDEVERICFDDNVIKDYDKYLPLGDETVFNYLYSKYNFNQYISSYLCFDINPEVEISRALNNLKLMNNFVSCANRLSVRVCFE